MTTLYAISRRPQGSFGEGCCPECGIVPDTLEDVLPHMHNTFGHTREEAEKAVDRLLHSGSKDCPRCGRLLVLAVPYQVPGF